MRNQNRTLLPIRKLLTLVLAIMGIWMLFASDGLSPIYAETDDTFTITVTKEVNGNWQEAFSTLTPFEICLAELPNSCKSFTAGQTKSWPGLVANTYTIVEQDPGPYWEVITPLPFKVGTTTLPLGPGTPPYQLTVTNNYIGGSLQVNTSTNWNGFAPLSGQQFEVCIEGPSTAPTKQCKLLSSPGTHTWDGLLPGQYTVTETFPGNGWIVRINPQTVTVPEGGQVASQVSHRVKAAKLLLTKQATPTSVAAGQSVTYDFSIKHGANSETFVDNLSITDDGCTPAPRLTAGFNSGDTDKNNRLDLGETWLYRCSKTINEDSTNSASAEAFHPLGYRIFSNQATTTVDVLPKVKLTKSVNPASMPEPGGTFVYTLEIENTAQEDVDITDLTDTQPLSAECLSLINQSLAPGETKSCSYGLLRTAPGEYTSSAVVTVEDDEANVATASDSASAIVIDLNSSLRLTKEASTGLVPEAGESVAFKVTVENTSVADVVTITELGDSIYGDITFAGSVIETTNCTVNQVLLPGASYVCTFSGFVSGNTGDIHKNFVTALGIDDDGKTLNASDSATIVIADSNPVLSITKAPSVASLPEPGGSVQFNITVKNGSPVDAITINSLIDSVYGDITATAGDDAISEITETTCAASFQIPVGDEYSCSFVAPVVGPAGYLHENTVVVIGEDNDGSTTSAFAAAEVEIIDVPASLDVTKTANKTSVLESGETVGFVVTAVNSSSIDEVEITTVIDDQFGSVGGGCSPALPATLIPGAGITCRFTETVAGDLGNPHVNTVTVSGYDDDNVAVSASDSAQIPFIDVPSQIEVTKRADRTTASRSGEPVKFSVSVANLSETDAVTIEQISDSIYDLVTDQDNGKLLSTSCSVPQTLEAGQRYECVFEALVIGELGDEHRNLITVQGKDDDQQNVRAEDDAIVRIADPVVSGTKTAQLVDKNAKVANPGDTILYTITIENSGNAAAEEVAFNDILDDNTTLVVGSVQTTLGTIESGNTAGDSHVTVLLNELEADTSAVIMFEVTINADIPDTIVRISNQGLITGENFPTVSTQSLNGGPTETFVQSTPVIDAKKSASLAVDSNGDERYSPGDQVLYEIELRNVGSATATNLVLNDVIDANATLVNGSVNTTRGTIITGNESGDKSVQIKIAELKKGESALIRLTVRIKSPLSQSIGQISNQASITTAETSVLTDDPAVDGAQDPTVIALGGIARVDASKTALLLIDQGAKDASAGDTLIYQVTVRNSGSEVTSDVVFEDLLDPNTTLDVGSVQTDQGSVLTGNGEGDESVLVKIGTLAPNGRVKISFRAQINPNLDLATETISNQGMVRGVGINETRTDDPTIDGRLDPTVTVLRATAVLRVSMTDIFLVDADGDNFVSLGDTLLYQITLSNVGKDVARQILVEGKLDPNITLVPQSVTSQVGKVEIGNDPADRTVLISIGALAEGETTMMSFQTRVTSIPRSGFLSNQVLGRFTSSEDGQPTGQQIEFQSDDPSTDEANDATLTKLGEPILPAVFMPVIQ